MNTLLKFIGEMFFSNKEKRIKKRMRLVTTNLWKFKIKKWELILQSIPFTKNKFQDVSTGIKTYYIEW